MHAEQVKRSLVGFKCTSFHIPGLERVQCQYSNGTQSACPFFGEVVSLQDLCIQPQQTKMIESLAASKMRALPLHFLSNAKAAHRYRNDPLPRSCPHEFGVWTTAFKPPKITGYHPQWVYQEPTGAEVALAWPHTPKHLYFLCYFTVLPHNCRCSQALTPLLPPSQAHLTWNPAWPRLIFGISCLLATAPHGNSSTEPLHC